MRRSPLRLGQSLGSLGHSTNVHKTPFREVTPGCQPQSGAHCLARVRLILQVLLVDSVQLLSYRSIDELIERNALAVCVSGRQPANIDLQGQIKCDFGDS